MSIVLVTGATGLLGSALTRSLVSDGCHVRIYRRKTSNLDLLSDIKRDVEHAVGDISDSIALGDAMHGVDRVFHAAAYIGFGGHRDREQLMRVNVDGTATVVNAAARAHVRRMVHVSSMAAFGRPDRPDTILDENATWQRSKANSVYAYSKYLSELEVYRGAAEGLEAVTVNPALVFGVGRPGDNTRRIIDRVWMQRVPAIPTGGTNVVDVLDVVEGTRLAMEKGEPGERYFLGSENLSWDEIIRTLAAAFDVVPPRRVLGRRPALAAAYASEAIGFVTGRPPLITREAARSGARTYRYSNLRAREQLGWRPRPFADTARRIAAALPGA